MVGESKMKRLISIAVICGLLQGCGLFAKKEDPIIQVVKEVHVVKEQVPDNLLIPCKRMGDLPYGVSSLDVLNLRAADRVENNNCADQIDNIRLWRDANK